MPKPPTNFVHNSSSSPEEGDLSQAFECETCSSTVPHLMTQGELNDLARDLDLSKSKAELLASRLKGYNYLVEDVRVTIFCVRHQPSVVCI